MELQITDVMAAKPEHKAASKAVQRRQRKLADKVYREQITMEASRQLTELEQRAERLRAWLQRQP